MNSLKRIHSNDIQNYDKNVDIYFEYLIRLETWIDTAPEYLGV